LWQVVVQAVALHPLAELAVVVAAVFYRVQ
jgi:hypothetical protein